MMNFPTYIPTVVREYITTLLDGSDSEPQGIMASLSIAKQRLSEIEQEMKAQASIDKDDDSIDLHQKKAELTKHRDMLTNNMNCLHRLVQRDEMKEVYSKLDEEFTNNEQWRGFISAAYAARMDYSKYRERLKVVVDLRDKIKKTTHKLAGLLRETSDSGFSYWPSDFFSIPELLRKTDNHEMEDHNLYMWRSMRRHILGDLPRQPVRGNELPQKSDKATSIPKIIRTFIERGEKPKIDKNEEAGNALRYAWALAPSLDALLDTVVIAANSFEPTESWIIGAAISTRQRSRAGNKDYLRAFGYLLTDVHGINTTKIMNAMAVVATVVIDDPNFVVSYDDVDKAIGKLVETRY